MSPSHVAERELLTVVRGTTLPVLQAPKAMPKTVEAVVDEDGYIRLPDSISLRRDQRVLVTILEEANEGNQDVEADSKAGETALLSEETLAEDWTREQEDEAWTHLQPDP